MQRIYSLQSSEIRLLEGRIQEIATDPGAEKNYKVDLRGGYIVIETNQGMNFMWDQKTTVVVHVAPSFQVGMGWIESYDFKVTHPELEPQFEKQGLEKCSVQWTRKSKQVMSCVLFHCSVSETPQNIWS